MILKKNNVERVTENEAHIAKLKAEGYKEVVQKEESKFGAMKVDELKVILDEKCIKYDPKAKKEDLIKLLEGAE